MTYNDQGSLGIVPLVHMLMTSSEVQLSFDAHHRCFELELEVTSINLQNADLPYPCVQFFLKNFVCDDVTVNYTTTTTQQIL